MSTFKKDTKVSIKVSYYSSYKDWKQKANLTYWPFLISFLLLILSALFLGGSTTTIFLLFFNGFGMFICVFTTTFYANAILEISDRGLKINDTYTKNYTWTNISPFSEVYNFGLLCL